MPQNINGKEYYIVAEVAKIFGVSCGTIRNWSNNHLRTTHFDMGMVRHPINNRRYFEVEAIHRFKEFFDKAFSINR